MSSLSRRTVLQASLGLALPTAARAAAPRRRRDETILVLGAGLAGLASAIRLREQGKNVIVLEARAVPGGRVRTLRAPFAPGLHGELGPARIADTHTYVQHWTSQFGLSLVPFGPPNRSAIFVANGMRAFADDPSAGARLMRGMTAGERGLTPGQLMNRYIGGLPESLSEPDMGPEVLAEWAAFDRLSWPAWLGARGASPAAIGWLTMGTDARNISALYVLRQIMLHRSNKGYLKIADGMDRLPQAMARHLGDAVRYGCEVIGIAADREGVRISIRERGEIKEMRGSRAILTLPFSVLRRIPISAPLSSRKFDAIAHLPYRPALRFLLQTRSRFWRKDHSGGAARTDAPAEIWDASFGETSALGLLSVTSYSPEAQVQMRAMAQPAQVQFGAALASAAFPETKLQLQTGIVHNWQNEPEVRGAFAVYYPGQMSQWGSVVAAPEGRLHFAGEHTSPWPGWMEGALWSAERVVQEV